MQEAFEKLKGVDIIFSKVIYGTNWFWFFLMEPGS